LVCEPARTGLPDQAWRHPPESPALASGDVHVWRISLDLVPERIDDLQRTLAPDERERAGRFYFQRDRDRFIVAHGALRDILGRYLRVEPGQVRFCYSSHGKPACAIGMAPSAIRMAPSAIRMAPNAIGMAPSAIGGGRDTSGGDSGGLRFNLAHSHRLALCAVTRGREVGIDLEYVRADLADERIAERFFSTREVAALRAVPKGARLQAFFNCWTRKEAYVKARGEGLSMPLDQFDVSLAPGEPAALVSTPTDPQEASRWSLQDISPAPGYVAAIAVEGRDWVLKQWQWPGVR